MLREVRSRQHAEITRLGKTRIGRLKLSVHSASSWTTSTHAATRVPFLQRRTTCPLSDQTPGPGLAQNPHPHQPPTHRVLLPLSVLPSGQTLVRGLPILLVDQSAAVHLPRPVASARVRLLVQLLTRQPRIPILTHHLIRRTPFRPPWYVHRGPLQKHAKSTRSSILYCRVIYKIFLRFPWRCPITFKSH